MKRTVCLLLLTACGQSAEDTGVSSLRSEELDLVVFVKRKVAEHRVEDFLQVFFHAFAQHSDGKGGRNPTDGTADVLHGLARDALGDYTTYRTDATEEVLQGSFGNRRKHCIVACLPFGKSFF